MQVNKSEQFKIRFKSIFEYISQDKVSAAIKFRKELNLALKDLKNMPYKFRKSKYFNNDNIRDMIFKGYIIVYKIDIEKEEILIIGINKYKQRLN